MRLPPHETQPTIAVMVKLMDDVECIKSLNVKCIIEENYTSKPDWFSMENHVNTSKFSFYNYKSIYQRYKNNVTGLWTQIYARFEGGHINNNFFSLRGSFTFPLFQHLCGPQIK